MQAPSTVYGVSEKPRKGTGASVRPLPDAAEAPAGSRLLVAPEKKPQPQKPAAPRGPRRFKVVDVMTREVLAEDADARATVDLLAGIRSSVDVSIFVWEEQAGAWQQLTQGEKQSLWRLRRSA